MSPSDLPVSAPALGIQARSAMPDVCVDTGTRTLVFMLAQLALYLPGLLPRSSFSFLQNFVVPLIIVAFLYFPCGPKGHTRALCKYTACVPLELCPNQKLFPPKTKITLIYMVIRDCGVEKQPLQTPREYKSPGCTTCHGTRLTRGWHLGGVGLGSCCPQTIFRWECR